jgi:hypothetical protein
LKRKAPASKKWDTVVSWWNYTQNNNNMKNSIILFLVIFLSTFNSCNSQSKGEKMEIKNTIKKNEDKLYERYIPLMNKLLKDHNYKYLNHEDFRNKIIDYFGVDIDTSEYNDVNVPNLAIVINSENFIDTYSLDRGDIDGAGDAFSEILKEGTENEFNKDFLYYNKILFYDDMLSISKVINDTNRLENIIIYFDYEKNDLLNNNLIKNIKNIADFNDDFKFHLLWYNNRNKSEVIRKKIISEITIKKPEFIFDLAYFLHANATKVKDKVDQKLLEETLAYLIESELKYYDDKDLSDNKGYSLLNNFYVQNPELLNKFKSNDYYKYDLVNKYTQTYLSMSAEEENTFFGKILDPDGYTNLRKDKNSTSDIIEKIKSGEKIEVLDDSGNWWYIQTKSGNKGYVYKTKIKSE